MSDIATITATYNREKYIEECLDSILKQTYLPKLMVVVDDCSTDNTCKIVEKFFKDRAFKGNLERSLNGAFGISGHSWVLRDKVVAALLRIPENKGPSGARNVAIQAAKYIVSTIDTIQIVDSDDVLLPEKIIKSKEILDTYPDIGLVYSEYDPLRRPKGGFNTKTYDRKELEKECYISNNSMFRLKAWEIAGGYDESLRGAEDWDLWLRITEFYGAYRIPESLYLYRVHEEQTTVIQDPHIFNQWRYRVLQKMAQRQATKGIST
jgi:glycosyltransferase involved in cell wall biosynthesis